MLRFALMISVAVLACRAVVARGDAIDFNRDIRPILSDKCFYCHGPDANHREADLRLDREDAAHDYAIVAGDPAESELVVRITAADPDERMPPVDSGKTLSSSEIELLRKWIEQGGKYAAHWAFTTPRRPEPPQVERSDWVRNPVDAFILAGLEKEGHEPSAEADRATLIRRVTLDLTGLPPTPAEVAAFVADDSPRAYEAVVDRLLASEHFGERMAIEWLDAARYADTMGYQADWERFQWRWRSWVIDAYNRNLPFDQFTIEQLAGDLLPDPTVEQLIATGFNRNHRINDEGGIIPAEYLVEYIIDRVETTSATWMGLTLGCARCHDHKFDPFSQADFYKLYAFFNGVPEQGKDGRKGYASPHLRVAVRGEQPRYDALRRQVAERERELQAALAALPSQSPMQSEEQLTGPQGKKADDRWVVVEPAEVEAVGAVDFKKLGDGSYLATGDNLGRPTYSISLQPPPGRITGIRLEALTHKSLTRGSLSPGNGNFVLTEFEVDLLRSGGGEPTRLSFSTARADYEQERWPIRDALDGKPLTGWAVDGHRRAENRTAVFTLQEPLGLEGGDRLTVRLRHDSKYARHVIGRFRLAVTDQDKPELTVVAAGPPIPRAVQAALRIPAAKRTKAQRALVAKHNASAKRGPPLPPAVRPQQEALNEARKQLQSFEKEHTTLVMVMREMQQPRTTHILGRGVYNQPEEVVTASVPAEVLGPLPAGAPANRLGLARWLVSDQHPLTARVIVNRYWAMLFGAGLVKTVEDFGLQGDYPSHPELLDWLATEYPRLGWDTKQFLRMLVTSATYRQSSEISAQLRQRDPSNRWLARMSRLRLPAETIRDQALFASGLLVQRIGGPSVKPYQPEGLWSEVSFQSKVRTTDFYVRDSGEKLYRRSLYTFWKRTVPPPAMATFDAPSREMCILTRPRTNTPLQALALMNDVTYIEACRALAQRAIAETGDDTQARVRFVFRTLLAREPDAAELDLLSKGHDRRLAFYRQNPAAAKSLIRAGESKADGSISPLELAALTTVAMNVLNLDETITRE